MIIYNKINHPSTHIAPTQINPSETKLNKPNKVNQINEQHPLNLGGLMELQNQDMVLE